MPSGEKGFKPGSRANGGKRKGAGRKPTPVELIEVKLAAEHLGQLIQMIPAALNYVHDCITDKTIKPDKVRLEAAKIVINKAIPDALIERAIERNAQAVGEMRESPLLKALKANLADTWDEAEQESEEGEVVE